MQPDEHDLVIGTHGRALFVLDDIRPFRELAAATSKTLHLFPPPDAELYRVQQTGASRFPGATEFRGENRPYGGMLTFWVDGEVSEAPAGTFVFGPKGIPHTFTVTSEEARFLLVAEPAGFEAFVRAGAEPAERLEIPPAPTEPPDIGAMSTLAAEYGVEILGPPGIPD